MTKEQQSVLEFMKATGQFISNKPNLLAGTDLLEDTFKLRYSLISEELSEYELAGDEVEIADALGDLLYVVYGAAIAHGIDLEPIFEEIHRSNMSKTIDGTFRADGKYLKGPKYSPADLKPIIEAQLK